MKSRQSRALQTFRRIQAWFAEHPRVLASAGSSQTALASQLDALKQVVDAMTAGATEQTTQKSQATLGAKDEKTLRTELRSLHVKTIVRMAGALRGKVPGMGVFKLPSDSLSSETLVHAAEAVRTTAGVYRDVFVEHGLPADFLDQLDAAMLALKESVDARGVARSRIAGASMTLASELSLGRQIVTMIDAALAHTLKSDAPLLASWQQAKRITVKGVTSRDVLSLDPSRGGVTLSPLGGASSTPSAASLGSNGSPAGRVAGPVASPAVPIGLSVDSPASEGGPVAPSEVTLTTVSESKAA